MNDDAIPSRPRYRATLDRDPTGRRHLLLNATPSPPALDVECWTLGPDFPSATALLAALDRRLASERIGLRLYATGDEAFLWDVAATAGRHGLDLEELQLHRAGPPHRRVQCVHCRTIIAAATTDIVRCPGCGAALFVRDHFSRRQAAFQGVRIDAEIPGDHPAPHPLTQ